jgi:quercetin dioxygenase-like cupin family protein
MRIMTLAAAMAVVALSQAVAADYPPAFPRAGARLVLDNAWGSAWDVTYRPGQPTPMHRHQLDSVGVELADSSVTVTTPDGAKESFPSKHGDSYYMPRGTTHIEVTPVGFPPRHAVIIELKDAPPAPTGSPDVSGSAFPGVSARKVTESPRVILWDYDWPRHQPTAAILAHNAFIVIVDGGELTVFAPDGGLLTQTVVAGQVLFRPAGAVLPEAGAKDHVRAVVVELK